MLALQAIAVWLTFLVGKSAGSVVFTTMGILVLESVHAFSNTRIRLSPLLRSSLPCRIFTDGSKHPRREQPSTTSATRLWGMEEEDNYYYKSSSDVDKWMINLRSEQDELDRMSNWHDGSFETRIVSLPPECFVRRLSVGTYPLAVCGSASEAVWVVDLDEGAVLAAADPAHANEPSEPQLDLSALELLYGPYDGGGTIALAVDATHTWVCVAGRSGGVTIYKYDAVDQKLVPLKQVLSGTLVTALEIADAKLWPELTDATLWVATAEGQVLALALPSEDYEEEDEEDDPEASLCWYDVSQDHPITALSLNPDLGAGVCATAEGSIYVFALDTDGDDDDDDEDESTVDNNTDGYNDDDGDDDGDNDDDTNSEESASILGIQLPDGDKPRIPHSVTLGRFGDGFSVVCGMSDGAVCLQPLNCRDASDLPGYLSCSVDDREPLVEPLVEFGSDVHSDTIRCLVCPSQDMLVTGSADGTCCVWDLSPEPPDDEDEATSEQGTNTATPKALYCIQGYKVWLGSLWSDGLRLVSDGSDNSIVVHEFFESMGRSTRFLEDTNDDEPGPFE